MEDDHTLFGARLPFPRSELWTALIAVALFLPSVILINRIALWLIGKFQAKPKRA